MTANLKIIAATFIAFILVGCMSVSYQGESFAPTRKVEFFLEKDDIPWKCSVMGVATATAPGRYSKLDIERDILDKARAEGADGVFMHSFQWTENPVARADQDVVLAPDFPASWGIVDDAWRGYGENSFEQMVPIDRNVDEGWLKVKAVFLRRIDGPAGLRNPRGDEKN